MVRFCFKRKRIIITLKLEKKKWEVLDLETWLSDSELLASPGSWVQTQTREKTGQV